MGDESNHEAFRALIPELGLLTEEDAQEETDIVNTGGALVSAQNFGGTGAVTINGIAHVYRPFAIYLLVLLHSDRNPIKIGTHPIPGPVLSHE